MCFRVRRRGQGRPRVLHLCCEGSRLLSYTTVCRLNNLFILFKYFQKYLYQYLSTSKTIFFTFYFTFTNFLLLLKYFLVNTWYFTSTSFSFK